MLAPLFALTVNLQWVSLQLLVVAGLLGMLAMISPRLFAKLSQGISQWIDTAKLIEKFDKPINIDQHVLRYSRMFGVVVMVSCVVLGYVLCMHVF